MRNQSEVTLTVLYCEVVNQLQALTDDIVYVTWYANAGRASISGAIMALTQVKGSGKTRKAYEETFKLSAVGGVHGRWSNKRRMSNKHQASNRCRGFEALVQINAGSVY